MSPPVMAMRPVSIDPLMREGVAVPDAEIVCRLSGPEVVYRGDLTAAVSCFFRSTEIVSNPPSIKVRVLVFSGTLAGVLDVPYTLMLKA